jgi:hypothetical protein
MSRNATKIAIVSTQRAQSAGMRRLFGRRPLVLRSEPRGPGHWWCTIGARNVALFDSEADARSWLYRTFEHPIDRSHLQTIEVRIVRQMDAAAR